MFVMNKKRNENSIHIYIYIYILHIQVHLTSRNLNIMKSYFLKLISKCETFINSRFIACKEKHFKSFLFVLIWAIRAYSS